MRMYGAGMASRPSHPLPTRSRSLRRSRPITLSALRGFEAAARRLSFTLAADELALTQSSVSRQVGALEHELGKALFVRKTRALELTAAGARLHAVVTQSLGAIDHCVEQLRGIGQPPRVSLTTYASFASLWLVPRLAAFQQAHPQIEIRIDASDRPIDLRAEGIDVAIRRGLATQMDAATPSTPLWVETVTPALSPLLLERSGRALSRPDDLAALPLIDMDEQWPTARAASWARWFEYARVARPRPAAGRLTFSFIDQSVQAALRAQGVVLGRSPLIEDAVANGQLCTPFPELRMPTGYGYFLLVNAERAASPEVSAFSRWLREEFARGPQGSG